MKREIVLPSQLVKLFVIYRYNNMTIKWTIYVLFKPFLKTLRRAKKREAKEENKNYEKIKMSFV